MYTIMGATGKVGAAAAGELIDQGLEVLLPVREPAKAPDLRGRGAQVIRVDYERGDELAAAFRAGPEGAFVMLPPLFDPTADFSEARNRAESLHQALMQARPARVVALSTIGAESTRPNLLCQLGILEQRLGTLPCPVTFLRAAWFMDNAALDLESARGRGVIDSYLQPLESAIPMVAAADVGSTVAQLLQEDWQGRRIVELEGPLPVSPMALAEAFAEVLGRPVRPVAVPRETWEAVFTAQGMRNPEPRIQMLDGFNEGWIHFASDGLDHRYGDTTLVSVVDRLEKRCT